MENGEVLLHVTERRFLESIKRDGLLTRKDRRGKRRIWLCDINTIGWAVQHVAATHDTFDLIGLGVVIAKPLIVKARPGIYWSYVDIPSVRCHYMVQLTRAMRRLLASLLIQE